MQFVPAIGLAIAAAASAASVGVQVVGIQKQQHAAKAQKSVLEQQEALANRDQLKELRRAKAAARAESAGAGVDILFGSPLDVLGGLEAQAFENFSRLSLDFENQKQEIQATSDALTLRGVGNILGDVSTTALGTSYATRNLPTITDTPL